MEPSRTSSLALLAFGALAMVAPAALAQVPAGSEFRVNTYTTGDQESVAIAAQPDGDLVVVWGGPHPQGSGYAVFGQRYAASGAPRGAEFIVGSSPDDYPGPSVAADARGRFIVVWNAGTSSGTDMYGRRFDSDGVPIGAEFLVNTYTSGYQWGGRIAATPLGDFVVVWYGTGVHGDVYGQRFDRTGRRLGGEFQLNTSTHLTLSPAVAVHPSNAFVATWKAFESTTSPAESIYARQYRPDGTPAGPPFRVNTYTQVFRYSPAVAIDDNGRFVVAWTFSTGLDYPRVEGRRFDPAGTPLGAEFIVASHAAATSASSALAGRFVVAWQGSWSDGNFSGAQVGRYDTDGTLLGGFNVNSYTTGDQWGPRVALDAAGNFTVAWTSYGQDGSVRGVFAQRFGGLHPRALSVDPSPGNGVLEPGETVQVTPSWENQNGAPVPFWGDLSSIAGPTGCQQSILANVCNYGTVDNGVTAACPQPYGVAVGSTRCQRHWDFTAIESIAPVLQGQQALWRFHVGGSFSDVPTGSPFYRFVETLLHKGVTGGCGPDSYCPSSSATREQMAAFVLAANEGAGYSPPACSPPNIFSDVPETSPFCGFIEELSSRGVVSGCGGGNYCPTDAVTREQMAVFTLRTLEPTLVPPPCSPPNIFSDVPETSPFCAWVEELANRGVVSGCGGGNYCPADPVTREQMAVFLSVTFGLALYGP